jgi:ABC-type dipeptide/oligopeptide/nickel transport system ATPase component
MSKSKEKAVLSTISGKDLHLLLQTERQERSERALSKIQAILQEERCRMEPVLTISSQGTILRVDIMPND